MSANKAGSARKPAWYKYGRRLPAPFKKAYRNYVYFRGYLSGLPFRVKGAPDGQPLPPSELMFKVAGTPDAKWFWQGGLRAQQSMISLLEKNSLDIRGFTSILDFGCGCGRVIRHLAFLEKTELFGTDYNADLIDWCQKNFKFASFATNQLEPPLSYEDGKFDFVYALSVFTHLSEELQIAWRNEVARVLKPKGYLLMTTHGEYYLSELSPAERARFHSGELVVKCSVAAGKNYCGAYHSLQYVQEKFGECFSVVAFEPKGATGNPFQDVYLLKKK